MQWALAARTMAPTVTAVAVGLSLLCGRAARQPAAALVDARAGTAGARFPSCGGAWFARQNHFEWMFNPLKQPAVRRRRQSDVRPRRRHRHGREHQGRGRRLSDPAARLPPHRQRRRRRQSRSSPRIERSATPVWCGARCWTGRRLTFRLAGINNQNFVMRDEQTGTWWQQVSGLAIQGPLKGRRLTLGAARRADVRDLEERGAARAASSRPIRRSSRKKSTSRRTGRTSVGDIPVRTSPTLPGGPLEPRTLVVGIAIKGKSKAWPHASVLSSGATIDQVGDVPCAPGRARRMADRCAPSIAA